MKDQNNNNKPIISKKEILLLHQLRLSEWMNDNIDVSDDDGSEKDKTRPSLKIPDTWNLTRGITLYPWQKKCVNKWFENEKSGTVKVVTGGGKTVLALALAEKLQNSCESDLNVAIVVPTIVLMHQWYDEIRERGNLPKHAMGRLGGGYKDSFSADCKILICVLVSAQRELPKIVKKSGVGSKLLLIADECHRFGAKESSKVFNTIRRFNLGLSATPEREEENADFDTGYEQSILGKELGKIIYDFNLIEALKLGIVPHFTINHYGLPLNPEESVVYERLSRSISESRRQLVNSAPDGKISGSSFFQWAQRMTSSKKGNIGAAARNFINHSNQRKRLIYQIESRARAVEELLEKEFKNNPDARVILFHESIEEVMNLFMRLKNAGFSVIAEHSKLPNSIREKGLDLFRKGVAQIIVSARSLIEGFNVPAVDMSIIVASSSSVRQRIQSLGRVLRKHRTSDGEEKTSCIHVFYAKDTVDEIIYDKQNWEDITGIAHNIYYEWLPGNSPEQQEGPPRTPLLNDNHINPDELEPGKEYPGIYEGLELSCDTHGNIRNAENQYAINSGDLTALVTKIKGSAGRFKITPNRHYVLVIIPLDDQWKTLFVTQLKEPLLFEKENETQAFEESDVEAWSLNAEIGGEYPFAAIPMVEDDLKFRSKRGGVISRRIPGGESFARGRDRAEDPEKGIDADHLIGAIKELHSKGKRISKIEINEKNHVLFREGGKFFFVCELKKGLEFPK